MRRANEGALASHHMAGYAVASASIVHTSNIGRRPTRSDNAPIVGSSTKLSPPTQAVTIRVSTGARWSTRAPNVGV